LSISPRTVEIHRANAIRKLGVRNLAELVRVVHAHMQLPS
jgi:DNA-binding CsgD family transcriptional regulator